MSNPPEEVLALPPTDLLAWVQQRIAGELAVDAGFNWHGLAEVAAMNAHGRDESPVWAEIAVNVYAWLAQGSEPRIAASFRLSEMYVRAYQISSFGACAGHATRDPQLLIEWFRTSRVLSYSQAIAQSAGWQHLPVEEIAKLRSVKNQLGVFVNLLGHLSSSDRNEFHSWLELRPNLP
jgi:hypothetical protein